MEVQVSDTIVTFNDKYYIVDEIVYLKKLENGKIVDSEVVLYYACNKVGRYEEENSIYQCIKKEEIKQII